MKRWLIPIAAAALSFGVLPASVSAQSVQPSEPSVRGPSAVRLRPAPISTEVRTATIISDSAMAGIRWNGALKGLRGFEADPRLESCRRLVARSCNGREGRRPATTLDVINGLPIADPLDVLIIATGYNDWSGRFAGDARFILDAAAAKQYRTVAWVNYRDEVSYRLPSGGRTSNYGLMNAELDRLEASGEHPALQVWDLDTYTRDSVGWFARDGVHERRVGSWGVADWVSRHMAHLDGRPCAVPWNLRWRDPLVCPNPDQLPEKYGYPDLVGLYGL